jgi:HTH-type transcriptional regulator / antitoxin HigA
MAHVARLAEVFPPGEYLRDELDARGWTITEFAEILGRPTQAVSEIINGRKMITATTAKEIGGALGTAPEVWLNLQNAYQLRREGPESSTLSDVTRKARLRARVPLAEIRRLGWIPASTSLDETEQSVRDLLGVHDLDHPAELALAARRKNTHDPSSPSQEAWLGRVRQLGLAQRTASLDRDAASELASQLSTRLFNPSQITMVPKWFARVGIAVIFVPALKGSKIDGVAMRTDHDRIVIGLSGRGNRFDAVVFTLAHELAHVLLGHLEITGAVLDEDLRSATDAIEKAANKQATQWLFPSGIPIKPPFGRRNVERAAGILGCHPSLVVGNLQWNGKLEWSHLSGLLPKLSELLPEFTKSKV